MKILVTVAPETTLDVSFEKLRAPFHLEAALILSAESTPPPSPVHEELKSRDREKASSRRQPVVRRSSTSTEAESNQLPPAPAPPQVQSSPAALPPPVAALPKKHREFYERKLSEYEEIYPPEKAGELALAALRPLVGQLLT